METRDEQVWTLAELAEEVSARLARNYEASENGQIRPVPDTRSIRYYSTRGLVDRPLEMRGRTALYGARHLAQLVAIKRLQSLGRSLAEIQELLAGMDDATLSRAAGVPLPKQGASRSRREREGFWRGESESSESASSEGRKESVDARGPVRTEELASASASPVRDAAPMAFAEETTAFAEDPGSENPGSVNPGGRASGERLDEDGVERVDAVVVKLAPGVSLVVERARAARLGEAGPLLAKLSRLFDGADAGDDAGAASGGL